MIAPNALRGIVVAAALVAVGSTTAQAQRTVYPSGPWVSDTRGSNGSAHITGNNPNNGNGSLELGTTGDPFDWGFFNLFSSDPFGFGALRSLSHLSFDWYRVGMPPTGDAPWEAQTPALRLYVRSGTPAAPTFSELVWERWYTLTSPAPTDQWVNENTTDQMFWRFVVGSGYTIGDCSNPATVTPGAPLTRASPAQWANGNSCYGLADAVVYGIGVGVGSNWPSPYKAYADNMQLGFDGDQMLAVNDNFELESVATPEPATLALLGSGLMGLGGAMARRRASRKKAGG